MLICKVWVDEGDCELSFRSLCSDFIIFRLDLMS